MKFSSFIHFLKNQRQCKSVAQLYKLLGGSSTLNMSLRNFNFIACGRLKPTIAFFISFFSILNHDEKKMALESFFSSYSDKNKISEFINLNIKDLFVPTKNSCWTENEGTKLNSDQLQFLIKNNQALRILHRLILEEEILLSDYKEYDEIIKKLIHLKLAYTSGFYLKPVNNALSLPQYPNASPIQVRESYQFLFSTLKNFISFDGKENQIFKHTTVNISRENLLKINTELLRVLEMTNLLSEKVPTENTHPFLLIVYDKIFESRDFL